MSGKIRIGYCGPPGKWKKMKWEDFISYANSKNVEMVWIDISKSIEEQGPFNLIIQKVTYLMENHNFQICDELSNLYFYSKNHPEVVFLDDLDAVAVTLDRGEMNESLMKIKWPNNLSKKVKIPKAVIFDTKSDDISRIKECIKGLHFPVIAKPLEASSSSIATVDESHTMRIASSPEQLLGIPTPSLIQEYVNHNGIVYKLYALGDHLEIDQRPSTRNILCDESLKVDFHSQKSDEKSDLLLFTSRNSSPNSSSSSFVPRDEFEQMSATLRKEMKMELVGIDVVIDDEKNFWIIDVNYFPGYKNIPNLWEKFLSFFLKLIDFSGKSINKNVM